MSLLDGYRYKLVSRYGLAAQVPMLVTGELGYDTDKKVGRIGDGTGAPPRVPTDKSLGAFDFTSMDSMTLPGNILVSQGKVGGIQLSSLNTANGFLARKSDGVFGPVVMASGDNSVNISHANGSTDTTDFRVNPDFIASLLQNSLNNVIPNRLSGAAATNQLADVDTFVETGWGFADIGAAHTPNNTLAWFIRCESTYGTSNSNLRYLTQFARAYAVDTDTNPVLYKRQYNGTGSFTAWVPCLETLGDMYTVFDQRYMPIVNLPDYSAIQTLVTTTIGDAGTPYNPNGSVHQLTTAIQALIGTAVADAISVRSVSISAASGNVTIDLTVGDVFYITTAGNITLNAIINGTQSKPFILHVTYGGAHTLSVNTAVFNIGGLSISGASQTNKVDVLMCMALSSTAAVVDGFRKGV